MYRFLVGLRAAQAERCDIRSVRSSRELFVALENGWRWSTGFVAGTDKISNTDSSCHICAQGKPPKTNRVGGYSVILCS